jgi:hypothetical protein
MDRSNYFHTTIFMPHQFEFIEMAGPDCPVTRNPLIVLASQHGGRSETVTAPASRI